MASAVTGGIGMVLHRQISRRDVLRAVLVSGAALAVPSLALAEQCRETPRQDEGPFYSNGFDRTRPVVHNNDLSSVYNAERQRLIVDPMRPAGSSTENLSVVNVALKPFRARS